MTQHQQTVDNDDGECWLKHTKQHDSVYNDVHKMRNAHGNDNFQLTLEILWGIQKTRRAGRKGTDEGGGGINSCSWTRQRRKEGRI